MKPFWFGTRFPGLGKATWGIFAALFSLVPFFLFQKNPAFSLGETLFPVHGDFYLSATWLQEVIAGGFDPFIRNDLPRMAAPFGPLPLSGVFPVAEQFQLAMFHFWKLFSKDSIVVWNLHFLAGYVLAAVAFYASALSVSLRPSLAFVLSIAFAYLPYHSLRYEHLFLSHYWVLAPAAALLVRFFRSEPRMGRRDWLVLFGSVGGITLWHSYYGFFYGGMLGLVFIWIAASRKSWLPLLSIVAVGVAFAGTMSLVSAHHFSAVSKSTEKYPTFVRDPSDSLLYSLRPEAVFLPAENHRFRFFRTVRGAYMENRYRIEGLTESIGFLGLVGFIYGLWTWRRRKLSGALGLLSLFVFLFSFRAGVGSAISFAILPIFRATNRISPLLAALCLFSFGAAVGYWLDSRKKRRALAEAFAVLALAGFVLWDQVPSMTPPYADHREMEATRYFVRSIENRVGSGVVLQLPAVAFPEQPVLHRMGDYSHAAGPLFSSETRWSYGAWMGSEALAKTKAVAKVLEDGGAAPVESLERLSQAGYAGIWVDRYGYADNGEALVRRLEKFPGVSRIDSRDGRRVFFDLH